MRSPLDQSFAPWTEDQVKSLNAFQRSGIGPEYFCRSTECPGETYPRDPAWIRPGVSPVVQRPSSLTAHTDGWHCPRCQHVQTWAYEADTDWSWQEDDEWLRSRGLHVDSGE